MAFVGRLRWSEVSFEIRDCIDWRSQKFTEEHVAFELFTTLYIL